MAATRTADVPEVNGDGAVTGAPAVAVPPVPARIGRCQVLVEVPELADEIPPHAREKARRTATAAIVRLAPGEQPLQRWFAGSLHGPGLLVVQGLLAREVHVAGRTATELLGPGDLLRPWDADLGDPVPCAVVWQVLGGARLAVLDAFFADRIRPWPGIANQLLSRTVERSESLAVQRAIAAHPRLDMRVVMLLWHLAARWGSVLPDGGVRIALPLTHRLVGELVGAERPSVSHAIGRLTRAGLIARCPEGWRLYGTLEEHAAVALRPLPHP